ncbi:carboxymuconolactone decarboxylase family protein, partial [bacterium]|nr:carboxymuconolactone decarboxylase family protein [bacterium]
GVHVTAFAAHAKLTEEQVNQTVLGDHEAPCWDDTQSLLIEVIDQLCGYGKLTDEVRDRFQKQWNQAQQLEIMAVCGTYNTISFVANVSGISGENFGAKFPQKAA